MLIRWWLRKSRRAAVALERPDDFIWIDPRSVLWVQRLQNDYDAPTKGSKFDKWGAAGLIVDGDWDYEVKPFRELDSFQAYTMRFKQGRAWQQIRQIEGDVRRAKRKAKRYGLPWRQQHFIDKRLEALECMYRAFRQQNYRLQKDMTGRSLDELAINIGRNGEIIRNASAEHRLAVAQIAGLRSIPARVVVRHTEWQEIRTRISQAPYLATQDPKLRAHINHPDIKRTMRSHEL